MTEIQTGDNGQRIYEGNHLLQIAMPVGGIAAGCICLNGYGGLQDFSIRNAPVLSAMPDRHMPLDSAFALLHLPGIGKTRLVEGPFPPEKIFNLGLKSQGYNGGGFEGLPRFRHCSFKGEYPFGYVQLSDPSLPLNVTITGFNPFIPLDDINSGIPCAILEYRLENKTDESIPYQFSYHLSNLAQWGAIHCAKSKAVPGLGISFWNESTPESPVFGSAAFGILNAEPSIKACWLRGGFFDPITALWREVSTGNFQPIDALPNDGIPALNGGSLMVEGELAPGESIIFPVVITWYFPNITDASSSDSPLWHPFYSTQWGNALEVLEHVRSHYDSLKSRTQAFHDALFSSTVPAPVLDAVSANLAVLKSPTVLRYVNGDVWGWEGCFCDKGCCPGSCTHVWNYAQSMAHLFPSLERTLRQRELEESMDNRGHINFRAPLPGMPLNHDFHAAADGQLGGIMKTYREWQISGDRAWLERMYPNVKPSMDFCIEQWDPRHTGLIEEPHHNTYDIEFWGPEGMGCSFYLGGLAAAAALARDAGHPEDAVIYDQLAECGAKRLDEKLFNGEYYQQEVVYEGLRETSFSNILVKLKENPSPEGEVFIAEGPKYQYGSGCLSDGVFGAWLAKLCGIESRQNKDNIRRHLHSVYKYNFRESLWEHANTQRPGYALGDEPGLLLCSWPHGGKPTLPFVYSDEVWTGIEYQAASHLISEGMVEEGLRLVEAARSRYDGRVRNPWNEYECGSYYARSMSSYALLIALSGFRYSAASRTLTIAPPLRDTEFRSFFSTATGWGTFTVSKDVLEVWLQEGELTVETLSIYQDGQETTLHPNTTIYAGEPNLIGLSGNNQE